MGSSFDTYAVIIYVTDIEQEHVLSMFDWDVFYLKNDEGTYYRHFIQRDGRKLPVIALRQNEKGSISSATTALKAINSFNPQYVIMPGIAAGIHFKHKQVQPELGDVVVADSVWNLSKGKYAELELSDLNDGEMGYIPRPSISNITPESRKLLRRYVKSDANPVRTHIGTFLTAGAVVANSHFIDRAILSSNHVAKALDMESYGLFYACEISGTNHPTPIIAKGISDFADEHKSDESQNMAACNSVAFVAYLLENLPYSLKGNNKKNIHDIRLSKILKDDFKNGNHFSIILTACNCIIMLIMCCLLVDGLLCSERNGTFIPNNLYVGMIASALILMCFCFIYYWKYKVRWKTEFDDVLSRTTKMENDMQLISEIRKKLLAPGHFENENILLDAHNLSGNNLECDFYDYDTLGHGKFALMICSPLAQSVPSGFLMMLLKDCFNIFLKENEGLAQATARMNEFLTSSNLAHILCESWTGVYDSKTQILSYVNAGHLTPVLVKSDGTVLELTDGTDNPKLGLDNSVFTECKVDIGADDRLILISRGIEECRNAEGEIFGRRRLLRLVCDNRILGQTNLPTTISAEVKEFSKTGPVAVHGTIMSVLFKKKSVSKLLIGHIVDVEVKTIFDGRVEIGNGKIGSVTPSAQVPKEAPYILPGFIDSHVHIESSMLTPAQFALAAARHGTIGIVTDPHEIANVLGIPGIDYMIGNAGTVNFNFLFGAPSCVPSCGGDVETCGAVLDVDDTKRLLEREDIGFLSEMMNYPGVLAGNQDVMEKIEAAKKVGKPVDGHAPGLLGRERACYASAGITTDHECTTLEEGESCVESGMYVLIREGSAAKNFEALIPLLDKYPEKIMFCTDDSHTGDYEFGHVNEIVKRALEKGYDIWDVLRAACITPQLHYGLDWGRLRQGDDATFIVVDSISPSMKILDTYVRGDVVMPVNNDNSEDYPNAFYADQITGSDIERIGVDENGYVHVIVAKDGELATGCDIVKPGDKDYPWDQVQKIVVLNRYVRNASPAVGLIRGFGIKDGAMASSVAHDCHNVVAVGSGDSQIVRALNEVISMKGGIVALCGNNRISRLALPIAGLMSPLDSQSVARCNRELSNTIAAAGCTMHSPFITMSFMCLPVIPALKITDRGVFDFNSWKFVH